MKKIIFIIIIIAFSCKQEPKKEYTSNYIPESFEQLQTDVLYKGDTSSYYELTIKYMDENNPAEALIYSIIMSNKTNDYWASFNVFLYIRDLYSNKNVDSIDNVTAKMAIDYLEKAAKKSKNDEQAFDLLNKLPKDTINMSYKEKFKYIVSDE